MPTTTSKLRTSSSPRRPTVRRRGDNRGNRDVFFRAITNRQNKKQLFSLTPKTSLPQNQTSALSLPRRGLRPPGALRDGVKLARRRRPHPQARVGGRPDGTDRRGRGRRRGGAAEEAGGRGGGAAEETRSGAARVLFQRLLFFFSSRSRSGTTRGASFFFSFASSFATRLELLVAVRRQGLRGL